MKDSEIYSVIELPSGRFFSIQREWRKGSESYRVIESRSVRACLNFGNNPDELIHKRLREACISKGVGIPPVYTIRRVQASIINV